MGKCAKSFKIPRECVSCCGVLFATLRCSTEGIHRETFIDLNVYAHVHLFLPTRTTFRHKRPLTLGYGKNGRIFLTRAYPILKQWICFLKIFKAQEKKNYYEYFTDIRIF